MWCKLRTLSERMEFICIIWMLIVLILVLVFLGGRDFPFENSRDILFANTSSPCILIFIHFFLLKGVIGDLEVHQRMVILGDHLRRSANNLQTLDHCLVYQEVQAVSPSLVISLISCQYLLHSITTTQALTDVVV